MQRDAPSASHVRWRSSRATWCGTRRATAPQAAVLAQVGQDVRVLAVGRAGQRRAGRAARRALVQLAAEPHQRARHLAPAQRRRQLAHAAGGGRVGVRGRRAGCAQASGEALVVPGRDRAAQAAPVDEVADRVAARTPPTAARPRSGRAPACETRSAPRGGRGGRTRRCPTRAGTPRAPRTGTQPRLKCTQSPSSPRSRREGDRRVGAGGHVGARQPRPARAQEDQVHPPAPGAQPLHRAGSA